MRPAAGDLIASAKRFAEKRVAAAAIDWSLGGSPSSDIYLEAGTSGFLGIELPVERGGAGHGFRVRAAVCEAIAGADFGFAMSLVNTHNVALRLTRSVPAELADQFLPRLLSGEISACTALTERAAGSDVAAMKTRAERRGNEWVLSGEKVWIINARHAALSIVFAMTEPAAGLSGIGAFLVPLDAEGVSRFSIDTPFPQSSMGTGGFLLDRVVLPGRNMVLPPGAAFPAIMGEINAARTYVAAMSCGMLSAALQTVSAYGAKRQVFGKALAEIPSWHLVVSEAQSALAGIQVLTGRAVEAVEAGDDARLISAQAKILAVETAQKHLPLLLHAMGAEGLRAEHCLARHLAALQSAALTDGATGLLKENIARLAGTAPKSRMN